MRWALNDFLIAYQNVALHDFITALLLKLHGAIITRKTKPDTGINWPRFKQNYIRTRRSQPIITNAYVIQRLFALNDWSVNDSYQYY